MVIAIGILLAIVCLAVAAIPFLRYRNSRQTVDPIQVIAGLQAQRQQLFRELLELESGASAGAVPEPEFNAVSQTLRRRAAENLWIQHRWEERLADLDLAIEQFIAGHREKLSLHEGHADGAEDVLSKSCPECGGPAPSNAIICPNSGSQPEEGRPAP